jgi:hypothetical protein
MAPTLAELAQMRADCAAVGADFFVLFGEEEANADQYVLPFRARWLVLLAQKVWVRQFRIPGSAVAGKLKEAGFRVLSIAEDRAVLGAPANQLPGDYHWNETGSAAFGEAAARVFAAGRRPRR